MRGCVEGHAASTHRAHTDFGNPYSASGFETRMWWRVRSSGAQTASRSNNSASSGLSVGVGCGQSLPHTRRSGAAFTNACATSVASAYVGGPTLVFMYAPEILTHAR